MICEGLRVPKAHNPINPALNTVGVQCGETVLISMRVEDTPQHDNQQSSVPTARSIGVSVPSLCRICNQTLIIRHDGCFPTARYRTSPKSAHRRGVEHPPRRIVVFCKFIPTRQYLPYHIRIPIVHFSPEVYRWKKTHLNYQ